MKFDKTWLLALVGFTAHTAADPTWPSPLIDELEEIMFQTDSVNSRKFADSVSPCSNQANGAGRFAAAEWLRTAFHDMATHNRVQQTGGLDASIQYELNNGDNAGPAFATTLAFMSPFLSRRSSLSDLIALGVYTSVRTCRGPAVPFRPGRVDAMGPGAVGVPQPQNAIGIFRNQFTRMGFTNQEMIQVTACGHTLGSVHSSQFPDLVPPGTTPNNQISMDSTVVVFDNKVVTEYLGWNTTNPLIVGRSVASGRNSDWKVFSSDANTTMNGMSDPAAFQAACKAVLQKMIDVVPPAATLGDPILPYQVKPTNMQLSVGASASVLELTGSIRIRTTELPRTTIAGLTITYKNRNGGSICGGPCSFAVNAQGLGRGIDDEFVWFPIAVNIPVATGISSFVVTIRRTDGTSATYDNNGNEYPLQDAVFLQRLQSCLLQSSGVSTFTAAIRNDRANLPARVLISYKVNQDNSPVPRLTSMTLDLTKGACIGAYTLFSVSTTIPGGHSAEADFDFISGTDSSAIVESFRKTRILGGTCRAFTSPGTCSTPGVSSLPSSTVSSTTSVAATSTVSTATPVPSLYHRPTIGGYNLVSCWTEGTGARALGGATFVSADMTLERCMANCAGFDYWGTEYGVECYCGNSLHSSSNSAPLSECNMVCGGDSTQYCGAGNRIELYSTTATRSTTSVPAPTATLAHLPTIGMYSLVGCQTEGTGVRALTGAAQAADTMTLEMCADFCSSFTYFGTEYGRECYCGNSLHSSSTTAPLEQCNMVCAGNPFQYCGAGSRLELYRVSASDPTSSVQAFSTSSQVFSDIPSSAAPSSVAPSSEVASSADPSSEAPSSTLSSTASSEAPSSEAPSPSPSSAASSVDESSVPTSSTPSSVVSSVDESSVSASSAPPSSADVATTTSSSTTTPTGPAHRPTIVPFTLVGCQTEGTGARALKGKSYASGTELTLEACASFCSGFRYFGTEYSAECYCGNALHPSSSAAPIADCAMLCSGNTNEYCGGPNRLILYEDVSIAPEEPAPDPRQPAVAGDFVFLGCRTEATGARALVDRATASNTMSNEVCAAFCQEYQYFGTEYGAECYCGNVLNETSNEAVETDCSMLCSGADDEFCGNGNRLSVYVKQDSADE